MPSKRPLSPDDPLFFWPTPAPVWLPSSMNGSWLANADARTAWAHKSWPAFAELAARGDCLVILPVHGFANHGQELPLDQEELVGSELLRQAVQALDEKFPVLVLPPLRFIPSAGPESLLFIKTDTALELGMSIARDVQASGFSKLVFFNTSEGNTGFVSTLAIDARADFGLHTYVIHGKELGLKLDQPCSSATEAVLSISGLLGEIRNHRNSKRSDIPSSAPAARGKTPAGQFPAYRPFYLAAESFPRLSSLPNIEDIRVILPTASIEQHGHHLPVGVDAILGQAQLHGMLSGLYPDAPVLVAPPITYGKSNEHKGFAGTLSLGTHTFRHLVLELCAHVWTLGFRHIDIFNTHGGNTAVLEGLVRELNQEHPDSTRLLRGSFRPKLAPQENAWGMHADEWETSLMLACAPSLVDMSKATCEYPARLEDPGLLRPEKAPATFAWLTSDVSRSGVLGNPTTASGDKGREWLAAESISLRQALFD